MKSKIIKDLERLDRKIMYEDYRVDFHWTVRLVALLTLLAAAGICLLAVCMLAIGTWYMINLL